MTRPPLWKFPGQATKAEPKRRIGIFASANFPLDHPPRLGDEADRYEPPFAIAKIRSEEPKKPTRNSAGTLSRTLVS